MGGGDLNTKKSWHPNTLKNQERVWKAEQAAANEQRRIQDLQSEIKNERSREEIKSFGESTGVLQRDPNAKLDWMYKHPDKSVNAEEYLLGKSIDKNYENKIAQEKLEEKGAPKNHVEHDCIPFSIRNLRGQTSGQEAQVDLARKMQEDPLLAIRKREMESRAQMLQNPLKLMELKRLLVQDQEKRNIHKLAKKNKKNKEDLDALLAIKLQKIQGGKKPIDLGNLLSQKSSKKKSKKKKEAISDSDSDHHKSKSFKKKNKNRKKYCDESDDSTHNETRGKKKEKSSDDDSDYKNVSRETKKSKKGKKQHKIRSPSPHRSKDRREHLARNEKPSFERQKEKDKQDSYTYTPSKVSSDTNRSRTDHRKRKSSSEGELIIKKNRNDSFDIKHPHRDVKLSDKSSRDKRNPKYAMTEEEKERKRKEMMQNASERDTQRSRNLTKRDDEEGQHYDQTFIHKQLRQAAATGTVQDRIRSNVNNIQRSNRSMDVNFARR